MKMKYEDWLVRFSILSGVTMVVLGVVMQTNLASEMEDNIRVLQGRQVATGSGASSAGEVALLEELSNGVTNLQSVVTGSILGGFLIVFVGLAFIVWRGRQTTIWQNEQLEAASIKFEAQVEDRVAELRDTMAHLETSLRQRLVAEDDNPEAGSQSDVG